MGGLAEKKRKMKEQPEKKKNGGNEKNGIKKKGVGKKQKRNVGYEKKKNEKIKMRSIDLKKKIIMVEIAKKLKRKDVYAKIGNAGREKKEKLMTIERRLNKKTLKTKLNLMIHKIMILQHLLMKKITIWSITLKKNSKIAMMKPCWPKRQQSPKIAKKEGVRTLKMMKSIRHLRKRR